VDGRGNEWGFQDKNPVKYLDVTLSHALHILEGATGSMDSTSLVIGGKKAEGFVIPLGPVNLVFVKTEKGLVGCGAVDVQALEKFGYPAAKVRPSAGPSIRTVDDILTGTIAAANGPARALGITEGMSGREALGRL
jgi:uncharacterized protein YunC (DUF1805 family)